MNDEEILQPPWRAAAGEFKIGSTFHGIRNTTINHSLIIFHKQLLHVKYISFTFPQRNATLPFLT